MKTITPAERRALRAKAHQLHPCVSIGQHGLTPAVLKEIDVALRAHELIKVRVHGDERDLREAFLEEICTALDAVPVQHLGKLLIVWRAAPEPVTEAPEPAAPRKKARQKAGARRAGDTGGRMASSPSAGARPRANATGARRRRVPR